MGIVGEKVGIGFGVNGQRTLRRVSENVSIMNQRRKEMAENGREDRKCDMCEEPATHFSSPLGNPDEPALCDEHFEGVLAIVEKST